MSPWIGHRRWALAEGCIPPDTDYASFVESDAPIVARHTRLDSRQAENALLSTVAYADEQG